MSASNGFKIAAPGEKILGPGLHELRREVADLLGRGNNTSFPGAQPVSFSRRHIQELAEQDYYVCEKSDGFRYLMYCTNHGQRETIYLIDRRNDYWRLDGLHFPLPGADPASFHTGTLVDGELVNDKDSHHQISAKYLVFDCLVLDGNSLMHRTLDKRLAYFKDKVFEPYKALYKQWPEEIQYLPFVMELKAMQVAYGTEMMFKQVLPNLPHGNDGLIFTCRNTPYKHGTDPHILKWKADDENSIDFRLSMDIQVAQPDHIDRAEGITQPYLDYDAMPAFNLLVGAQNDAEQVYGQLYLTSAEWENLKALQEPLNHRIIECYMDRQKRWRYMRCRDDKDKPNYISTVESVIESIQDGVTKEELIDSAKGIRDAWKRREQQRAQGNPA